jgi:uracil-DNA glycosylase
MPDAPKSLADECECQRRRKLLFRKHVDPLRRFVNRLRKKRRVGCRVPHFDPLDGGVRAQVLFLLEAPGPKAVESGFVSRNNPDETAKNFFCINALVGLRRKMTVTWNVVPWYLGDGRRIRRANPRDIEDGKPFLMELLALLGKLRVVVLVGERAERIDACLAGALRASGRKSIRIRKMPHPSPSYVNRDVARRWKNLLVAVRSVNRVVSRSLGAVRRARPRPALCGPISPRNRGATPRALGLAA